MNATLARLTQLTAGDPLTAGDGPLLDAFLAGDQSAFAVLVRRHAGLVFATCRRVLRHQQDAEDAFQATFLVLARRAADVWPREAVGSWLFGVAHRVALKARAVRSRRTVREQPLEEVAGAEPSGPDFDLAEVVHRVVCRLPEMYRAAVVACDLEGLSRKEAAERLGWSEGTLSGRLARARDLLARRFRRLGLTLPAGGLVAVCAAPAAVSASAIQTTIDLATGTAAIGASAPVAALTEGVVRSMALFKFKAMTAALFVACAVGFGAFAASGAGAGEGAGDGPGQQTQPQGAPAVPVAAMADAPAKFLNEKQPAKPVTDRDRLQGTWRVVALTEDGKTVSTNPRDPWVIEVSGSTLKMPYFEGGGAGQAGWKQREYTFAVDETKTPRTIDLVAGQKPVGRGLYEFTLPSVQCATCHNHPFEEKGAKPLPESYGLCWPVFKDARKMQDVGVRLALTIDGKRPAKFGGAGVIVFELQRPDDAHIFGHLPAGPRVELAEQELQILLRELENAAKGKIDPQVSERLRARIEAIRTLLNTDKKPPAGIDPGPKPDIRLAVAALQRAQADLDTAEAELALSRARVAEAQARAEQAAKNLQVAQARVKAAEKAFTDAGAKPQPPAVAPGKADAVFTIHVRMLNAEEKVTRVKATGHETVLDALAYAGADTATKPDNFTVWVLREGTIMPVDLAALAKSSETKTNYVLKAGDKLFVQAKAGK